MYFLTMNGLSIYDGARFTNFNSENGLEDDIVNCVMEMGDDSTWVATNTNKINCLIKGKIKTLSFNSSPTPVINHLCRNNGRNDRPGQHDHVRKIRNGYWELVVDKSLPKGEYAFTVMSMMSMDGAVTIFAFGID